MSIELLWTLITLFVLNIYKICRYIICQNNQHLSYFCVILFICKMRVEGIGPNILNRMIYTHAGNLQVSTDYESTNQRELNLNRKVHMSELNLNIGERINNFYK
jgi:hypothetical protein